jgi:hypothetical protein
MFVAGGIVIVRVEVSRLIEVVERKYLSHNSKCYFIQSKFEIPVTVFHRVADLGI